MMKNKFLFLVMFLGVALFSGCNDDDNDDNDLKTFNAEKLTISVSGVKLSSKEAVLEGTTLTLKNVLPGEPTTVFTVTKNGNTLTGTNENDNRKLDLVGTQAKDELSLTIAMKVKSSLAGKWDLVPFDNVMYSETPLYLKLETTKDEVIFGTSSNPDDNLMSPVNFVVTVRYLMFGPILATALESVTLGEDGNIIASYTPDFMGNKKPEYVTSPKGLVLYNIVGDKIYIGLNIDGIKDDMGRSDANPLAVLTDMLNAGIPLEYSLNGSNLDAYVTRETLLPLTSLLPLLQGLDIVPKEYEGYLPLLVQVGTIVNESTTFDIGVSMQKAQ